MDIFQHLNGLIALFCLLSLIKDELFIYGREISRKDGKEVVIFHLIDNEKWGEVDGSYLQGSFPCRVQGVSKCEIVSSDSKTDFFNHLVQKHKTRMNLFTNSPVTVSLYNIHTWAVISKSPHGPDKRSLPTNLTMAESEESTLRFQRLFQKSFPLFDGYSTTFPSSTVPRTYFSGWNMSEFHLLKPISNLIHGAVFVASTCHRGDGNTKRMAFVKELVTLMRVDSLGKCMNTKNVPEGIKLEFGRNAKESLYLKQQAISNYMFYLAFENTNEPGYVTEKVFDGLLAGTVPIYLGSSEDCRKLIPSSKAAIFASDYSNEPKRLFDYLNYLMSNLTAYEEHRVGWRKNFDPNQGSELLTKSWPCRICEWASQQKQMNR